MQVPEKQEFKNDHDILIGIMVEVRQIKADIKDLKDGTSTQLVDHENKIEELRRWKSGVKIYLAIYGLVGGFLAILMINHLIIK